MRYEWRVYNMFGLRENGSNGFVIHAVKKQGKSADFNYDRKNNRSVPDRRQNC